MVLVHAWLFYRYLNFDGPTDLPTPTERLPLRFPRPQLFTGTPSVACLGVRIGEQLHTMTSELKPFPCANKTLEPDKITMTSGRFLREATIVIPPPTRNSSARHNDKGSNLQIKFFFLLPPPPRSSERNRGCRSK